MFNFNNNIYITVLFCSQEIPIITNKIDFNIFKNFPSVEILGNKVSAIVPEGVSEEEIAINTAKDLLFDFLGTSVLPEGYFEKHIRYNYSKIVKFL